METIPGPASKPEREDKFIARIKEDPTTGKQWYLDEQRKLILVNDMIKQEFQRQQLEKAAGREVVPSPGFSEFGTMLGFEEMPVAPGEIAPEESQIVEIPSGASETAKKEPPFASTAEKEQAQTELRAGLAGLAGRGINIANLTDRIEKLTSPAAGEAIKKDIEILKAVKSPFRRRDI